MGYWEAEKFTKFGDIPGAAGWYACSLLTLAAGSQ